LKSYLIVSDGVTAKTASIMPAPKPAGHRIFSAHINQYEEERVPRRLLGALILPCAIS